MAHKNVVELETKGGRQNRTNNEALVTEQKKIATAAVRRRRLPII